MMAFLPTKMLSDLISAQRKMKELKKKVFSGISRDGKVKVKINGVLEISEVNIDESLLNPDYKRIVEHDICDAHKEAMKKSMEEMKKSVPVGYIETLSKLMR